VEADLFKLDNKVVVVTGAAGLLGRKHAEVIARYKGIPILLDLSQEKVNLIADDLNDKYGVGAVGYSVDITNEQQIKMNAELILEKFGKIDGLVNNAANNPKIEDAAGKNFSRLENFSMDTWNQDISVGLTGAFLCAKHYGYKISQNPKGGAIVNVSSDLGLIAPDQRLYANHDIEQSLRNVKPITYSVVKAGLIGLTRYLSTYWPEQNVRCNAMCPGGIENGQPEGFVKEVSTRIPMARMAKVDEYQGTLVWMLSDASSYLTGAVVPVDGGRTAW
jgi:NAD(P)-dependent dehydrogenase (short-subunit alcohol dehydrogenase family)